MTLALTLLHIYPNVLLLVMLIYHYDTGVDKAISVRYNGIREMAIKKLGFPSLMILMELGEQFPVATV